MIRNKAIILSSGPSFDKAQRKAVCDYVYSNRDSLFVVGINNAAYSEIPLDVLYACDFAWWKLHWEFIKDNDAKVFLSQDERAKVFSSKIKYIKSINAPGFSIDSNVIHQGGNSGYQMLNYCINLGYKEILFFGLDLTIHEGEIHWHGRHEGLNNPNPMILDFWKKNFRQALPQIIELGLVLKNYSPYCDLTDVFIKSDIKEIIDASVN